MKSKTFKTLSLVALPVLGLLCLSARADNYDQNDTSVVIHHGPAYPAYPAFTPPDYKILEDSEEVAGDPSAGRQESYDSWKKACADWKKELKDANGDRLISSNCGRPRVEKDSVTFQTTQVSTGTYRLKVSVRNTPGAPVAPSAPAVPPPPPAAVAPPSTAAAIPPPPPGTPPPPPPGATTK
jgi:hypothetical protein